jgi:hypothetical protein
MGLGTTLHDTKQEMPVSTFFTSWAFIYTIYILQHPTKEHQHNIITQLKFQHCHIIIIQVRPAFRHYMLVVRYIQCHTEKGEFTTKVQAQKLWTSMGGEEEEKKKKLDFHFTAKTAQVHTNVSKIVSELCSVKTLLIN